MKCKDCGKENPAEIHTCSPQVKQEPVAWMELYKGKRNNVYFNDFDIVVKPPDWTRVPLYTTPQYKELSDKEIYDILWNHFPISDKEKNGAFIEVMTHCIKVAIKKASEK